jgi:hypothetical protein
MVDAAGQPLLLRNGRLLDAETGERRAGRAHRYSGTRAVAGFRLTGATVRSG